ncbi:MAG: hypothetical protein R2860_11135 [Desulfobacterales bacterium]
MCAKAIPDLKNLERMGRFFQPWPLPSIIFPKALPHFVGGLRIRPGHQHCHCHCHSQYSGRFAGFRSLYYATGDRKKAFGLSFLSGFVSLRGAYQVFSWVSVYE